MKKIKAFLTNAWIMSILCSIIATIIVSAGTALHQKINFLQAALKVFLKICELVKGVLIFRIPVFVIILIILGLVIITKIIFKVKAVHPDKVATWLSYKRQFYKKWYFAWDYEFNSYSHTYEIVDLRPICKCGCELSVKGDIYFDSGKLLCPKCSAAYPMLEEDTLKDFHKVLVYDIQNNLVSQTRESR